MRTPQPRTGFTLLELMVVLAILVIMAAFALPSLSGLKGNSDQKAASDLLRARIADARGLAMQEAVPYRLAINADGTKIRVAPDTTEFSTVAVSDEGSAVAKAVETTLTKATVEVEAATEDGESSAAEDDWITVATFLPNGTCREASAVLRVIESGFPPIRIQLRGLTGSSMVMPNEPSAGGMK